MAPQLQIVADDFTKAMGQHHTSVPSSFFSDPQQATGDINVLNIQGGQGTGSKTESAQQHDDDEISHPHG